MDQCAARSLIACLAVLALMVSGCGSARIDLAPHLRPISVETMSLLGKKGM